MTNTLTKTTASENLTRHVSDHARRNGVVVSFVYGDHRYAALLVDGHWYITSGTPSIPVLTMAQFLDFLAHPKVSRVKLATGYSHSASKADGLLTVTFTYRSYTYTAVCDGRSWLTTAKREFGSVKPVLSIPDFLDLLAKPTVSHVGFVTEFTDL